MRGPRQVCLLGERSNITEHPLICYRISIHLLKWFLSHYQPVTAKRGLGLICLGGSLFVFMSAPKKQIANLMIKRFRR